MKLATLNDGTRDGTLLVVNKDMSRAVKADTIAPTLQSLLDNWDEKSQHAEKLYADLNANPKLDGAMDFDTSKVMAPLPRAYEWIDGSAYINHIVLVRKARGAEPPETLRTDPLVYQGGSGVLLSCREDIALADEAWGLDFESEVVVVMGDTPQGTKAKDAGKFIRLVGICNDVSLRNLIPGELQKGFGFFTSKPASAFSPVFVTPDELGSDWQDGKLNLPMMTHYNGKLFGEPESGPEMFFSFHQLMEHICKTRSYTAGTILGSGTVSNEDRSKGSSCLAEKRMIEKIDHGEITTPFMKPGDDIQIEVFDRSGSSVFGQIKQKVVKK